MAKEKVTYVLAKTIFLDDNKTLNPGMVVGHIEMEYSGPPRFLADGIVSGAIVPEGAMPLGARRPVATAQTLGMPDNPGLSKEKQGWKDE